MCQAGQLSSHRLALMLGFVCQYFIFLGLTFYFLVSEEKTIAESPFSNYFGPN